MVFVFTRASCYFFCIEADRVFLNSEVESQLGLRWRIIRKKQKTKKKLKLLTFNEKALSIFFKNKITIVGFNYGFRKSLMSFLYIFSATMSRQFRVFKKLRDFHRLLCVLFSSMRFKDAALLPPVIQQMFEPVHYSKHRSLYFFWRSLIFVLLPHFFIFYNVGGVKLEFHGKLGVGGNAKKRSYYFSRGLASNSTKFLKIDTARGQIRTATGVVGFTYSIFY